MPGPLEVAEVEIEVAIGVGAHARHPAVTARVFEESFFLVERAVPVALRELLTLLCEDEGGALCTGEDGFLASKERHQLFGCRRSGNRLLEHFHFELASGGEFGRGLGEVRIGDGLVVEVTLLCVFLLERGELGCVHVVGGNGDVERCDEREAGVERCGTRKRSVHGFGQRVVGSGDDLLRKVGSKTSPPERSHEFGGLSQPHVTYAFGTHDVFLSKDTPESAGSVARK